MDTRKMGINEWMETLVAARNRKYLGELSAEKRVLMILRQLSDVASCLLAQEGVIKKQQWHNLSERIGGLLVDILLLASMSNVNIEEEFKKSLAWFLDKDSGQSH